MSASDSMDFERLLRQHRAQIQLHCYRMLGSLDDAEDATQEVSLRAWRARDSFAGRSSFRTWIYRIAVNTCLDHLRRQARRPEVPAAIFTQVPAQIAVPWLQPRPDPSDAGVGAPPAATPVASEPGPEQQVASRETFRLAFVAAVQYLPARQRNVFLLRDCLGWPVRECAEALESSTSAINSALQRARTTMRTVLDEDPARWTTPRPGDLESQEQALVERYVNALERADDSQIAALLDADTRVSHAPRSGGNDTDGPVWYTGRQTVVEAWYPLLHANGHPELRFTPLWMNAQPGLATYTRMPGQMTYEPFALNALTIVADHITEVATFSPDLLRHFRLPSP